MFPENLLKDLSDKYNVTFFKNENNCCDCRKRFITSSGYDSYAYVTIVKFLSTPFLVVCGFPWQNDFSLEFIEIAEEICKRINCTYLFLSLNNEQEYIYDELIEKDYEVLQSNCNYHTNNMVYLMVKKIL